MITLLNQQLVQYHMQALQRDAQAQRRASLALINNTSIPARRAASRFHLPWFARLGPSHQLPAQAQPSVQPAVRFEEIRPAVLLTFSALRQHGLVSDYDDCFIQTFVDTLEHKLAQQNQIPCA